MRHPFTPGQITMLVYRAEHQLQQLIDDSAKHEPSGKTIARSAHAALHESVVSLIRLFRDNVPGAEGAATAIARAYAKGVDASSGAPTLTCVRMISSIARDARESHLPSDAEPG